MHLKKYKKCPSHFSIVATTSQFLLQMFIYFALPFSWGVSLCAVYSVFSDGSLSNSRLMLVTCVNRCFEKSIECAIGSESKAKQIAQT